ncbi:MAG TPA: hypothetical protein PKZ88_08325 [Methanothermobacter sp.]|nr:hypothetical protein [Methanothermobacter sp.]
MVLEKKFSKKTPGIPLIPFLYSLILVAAGTEFFEFLEATGGFNDGPYTCRDAG